MTDRKLTDRELLELATQAGWQMPVQWDDTDGFLRRLARFAALIAKHIDPMNEMWEALEKYQPYAEKHGFGAEWKRMTTERTEEAAYYARMRASEEPGQAAQAAWKVAMARDAAVTAVKLINKAIEMEENET